MRMSIANYCEAWTESDAPVLGNSGKRKRQPRIDIDSPGWTRLRKELGELDRAGNDAEAYRLLQRVWRWQHLSARADNLT